MVNSHEIITGDFTRDTEFRIPGERLSLSLEARLKDGLAQFDATTLSAKVMGDAIYSNMILLGASWQLGQLPLTADAIREAIRLNGAKVDANLKAFEIGRWAAVHAKDVEAMVSGDLAELPKTLNDRIAIREEHLRAYQGARLVKRYRKLVDMAQGDEAREAIALGYHKLLTYKDEYEVARLLQQTREKAEAEFEGDLKLSYHLAPPLLARKGSNGRPTKRAFGSVWERAWPLMAKLRWLRGTPFDPFGYSKDRRLERKLIRQYERDIKKLLKENTIGDAALELMRLPLQIRGFGPVKEQNAEAAAKRRGELLDEIASPTPPEKMAAE